MIIIKVKIIFKSKSNEIIGLENDIYKIKIKAVPEKGKANKELIEFLAKKLSIAKSYIKIISGKKSRIKTLQIDMPKKKDQIEKLLLI